MICLRLLKSVALPAWFFALLNAGSNSAASIAMMAMTVSSSISVKARRNRMRKKWSVISLSFIMLKSKRHNRR
jgi:acetolactate synthase regulatory subunit